MLGRFVPMHAFVVLEHVIVYTNLHHYVGLKAQYKTITDMIVVSHLDIFPPNSELLAFACRKHNCVWVCMCVYYQCA